VVSVSGTGWEAVRSVLSGGTVVISIMAVCTGQAAGCIELY
jgi:hypothetical protein